MAYPIISADSHITEPPEHLRRLHRPGVARSRAAHGARRRARRRVRHRRHEADDPDRARRGRGQAARGAPRARASRFEDLHRGGWDPEARLADQDRDGVAAEVIYPTVGMVLCNHRDFDYKKACFDAYNRWIAEYCSTHPERLLGVGQTAMRTPEEGIADLEKIKALGLRGVMMPGNPALEDYDSPIYDEFWEAAIELELPLSFHILTARETRARRAARR